jgi:hypothetical protein
MKTLVFTSLIFISVICASAQKSAVECVRSVPEPILSKKHFPGKTFNLTNNQENPSEQIGTEKVKLNTNTNLTIKNWGCENYTLTFRFETGGFSHNLEDTKFWYRKIVELMNQIKKGIRSTDRGLINRGANALSSYLKRTRKQKFEHEISFGGNEIRYFVIVNKTKKLEREKYRIEITYSVGPL